MRRRPTTPRAIAAQPDDKGPLMDAPVLAGRGAKRGIVNEAISSSASVLGRGTFASAAVSIIFIYI